MKNLVNFGGPKNEKKTNYYDVTTDFFKVQFCHFQFEKSQFGKTT